MNRTYKGIVGAISLIVAVSTASIATAHAQPISQAWTGACVNLSINLSLGSKSSDVVHLQQFLVNEDFPGGGTWMETGYYGAATVAAVKDFQEQEGLSQTGVADAATRAAISSITCGGALNYVSPANPISPVSPTIPWNQYGNGYTNPSYPSYPYTPTNPLVSLNLTGLSQNTGSPGTQVTIYGTGFDPSDNTINFGSVGLSNVPSNGTSLSFIVPQYQSSGTINITVTNSLGTSNAVTFTVYSYSTCGSNYFYAYGSTYGQCGCSGAIPVASGYTGSYPYNYYGNCGTTTTTTGNVTAPTISYLNPNSGAVGADVTVFGSGFTQTGNSVHFGAGVIANLISTDGDSVSFQVPSQLNGYGSQNVGLGTYGVSVTNGDGYSTSNASFTVTALTGTGANGSITNITGPSSLAAGTTGTWNVTIQNPNNASVTVTPQWGDTNIYPYNGTVVPQAIQVAGQTTLTFTHAYSQNGTYTITFTVSSNGTTQTSANATVVVSGSSTNGNVPSISYLSPTSGYVGQQVTIYGTNFASTDTIDFGSGAIGNVSSNGSQITFTIPSYVAPYCASGTACPQYVQQVTPGSYNISVMNQYGTSNTISFQVL